MSDHEQLQPEDTLDDRGVDDILDEGISPPERLRGSTAHGVTAREQIEGETIEDRLRQEEPEEAQEESPAEDDPSPPGSVGDRRAGRLIAPDEGARDDVEPEALAEDVGIDGAGASAEEAAVHVVDDNERES
ncbi:MAG: DUF5709 domain-containing protein [Marmoricola sp.]